ncbi:uncharacterized protein METZ01_LOCUS371993 [marine metagenome]|uniref:Uncharacterized protein n=1 Tax=marine metagenome TaxID=408172 RepID=A0A382TAI2_9ZZZZ
MCHLTESWDQALLPCHPDQDRPDPLRGAARAAKIRLKLFQGFFLGVTLQTYAL